MDIKQLIVAATFTALMVTTTSGMAQSAPKSIAQTLDVSVFPSNGQTPEQQSKDEGTCYNWAVTNSGVDPFKVQKEEAAQAQQSQQSTQEIAQAGAGAGARGAVGGAAAGALIGEIGNDDPGKGAAWGAAVGGIMARRRAHRAQEDATQQVNTQQQQSQQLSTEQMTSFKNSFSACLEGKKYMVKF